MWPIAAREGINHKHPSFTVGAYRELDVLLGLESGQRKRYLKSLAQDLESELGPNWRDKIANSSES